MKRYATIGEVIALIKGISGASVKKNASPAITETATGSIVTIPDGADGVPVKSLIAQINPVQAGSGDPAPDNIRAITGWTGLQGFVSGKNILSGDAMRDMLIRITGASDRWHEEERYFLTYGGSSAIDTEYIRGIFKENTQYTFIFSLYKTNSIGLNLKILYTDGTVTNFPALASAQTKEIITVTSVAGKTIKGIYGRYANANATRIFVDESGIFEGEITAAEYEAWKGQTFNIAFPTEAGTVYGGTLDVTNGILTVDKVKMQVLSVDLKEARYAVHYIGNIGSVITASNTYYCNLLKKYTGTFSEFSDNSYAVYNSAARNRACIGIRFGAEYSTIADYNNKLSELNASGTPLEVVYQLVEPLAVYHLSPIEVSTLLGINNIWADTGDVSVEYRADTKTYIDNQIAALQATILENTSNA